MGSTSGCKVGAHASPGVCHSGFLHECSQDDCVEPVNPVHLIPAGSFSGRDGRGPYYLDAESVMRVFGAWGGDLVIDYEHQSITALSNGHLAPAAGWIKGIELRRDGLWGNVQWTDRAKAMILSKEYRYLSPVFSHDKEGRITAILGAGLTNQPNLQLTALHRATPAAGHDATQWQSGGGCSINQERLALHRVALEIQRLSPGMTYHRAVLIALA